MGTIEEAGQLCLFLASEGSFITMSLSYLNHCCIYICILLYILQLLGRMGTIEEAGQLCLFLASEGSFITGIDVPLSGGAELNYGKKNRRLPDNQYL